MSHEQEIAKNFRYPGAYLPMPNLPARLANVRGFINRHIHYASPLHGLGYFYAASRASMRRLIDPLPSFKCQPFENTSYLALYDGGLPACHRLIDQCLQGLFNTPCPLVQRLTARSFFAWLPQFGYQDTMPVGA